MPINDDLVTAQNLLKQKRYDEARSLLRHIDHPTAKKWLAKIDERTQNQSFLVNAKLGDDDIDIASLIGDESTFPFDKSSSTSPQKPRNSVEIIVTTGDLHFPYKVIGPVYFQISNKGLFSSPINKLAKKYQDEISQMRQKGMMTKSSVDWSGLFFEGTVGQNQFELAFLVAVREIQKRAEIVGGDAIVGMRQDIDLDTHGFQHFYLQMYGTAVQYV